MPRFLDASIHDQDSRCPGEVGWGEGRGAGPVRPHVPFPHPRQLPSYVHIGHS